MKLLILIVILLFTTPVFGENVTLGWDANTEEDLAGYRLYYGFSARSEDVEGPNDPNPYTTTIDIPNATAVTITVPLPVGTYYFALTAYDLANNESGFSNEVSADIIRKPGKAILSLYLKVNPPSKEITLEPIAFR